MHWFGWSLRGGISLGDIHLSDDIVSGTPLIEAVEIEENISIYPRIVLGQSIQKEIGIHRLNKLCEFSLLLHATVCKTVNISSATPTAERAKQAI